MATKIIKAWIDGAIQEIEVEEMISPEQPLSYDERLDSLEESEVTTDERLDVLEDKPVITDGNLLVGNGTTELEEMTPEEVLSHINGASVTTMTTAEYEAMTEDETNANTLYMLTDDEDNYYTIVEIDEKVEAINNSISNATTEAKSYSDANLISANTYTDVEVSKKSQVQMISTNETESVTQSLQTLKIHKLSKEKYEEELANGRIDETALYLTPDEDIDLSIYATIEQVNDQLNGKADTIHNHAVNDITGLQDVLDEKAPANRTVNGKSLSSDIVLSADDVDADPAGSADAALSQAKEYVDNAVAQTTTIQFITWEADD